MSWTLEKNGGNQLVSNWNDILNQLEKLKGREGSLTLDILACTESEVEMLQVRAESGYYLVTLGEIVDGEYQVRTHWDHSKSDTKVVILGDCWPEQQIIKKFDLVVRIFREFFDTGNVSKELLN